MYETTLLEDAKLDSVQRELLDVTWKMLDAIHTGDADTYARHTAPELSCYEDVCPYRIDGLEFHLTMIRQMAQNSANQPARFDMLTPRVQVYGDTGVVTYTRLMTYDEGGKPRWTTCNETRVFVKRDSRWQMVHFHRSPT
jgi:calcium/calmodulin-dependent protein kinase (CaM kinase) II